MLYLIKKQHPYLKANNVIAIQDYHSENNIRKI